MLAEAAFALRRSRDGGSVRRDGGSWWEDDQSANGQSLRIFFLFQAGGRAGEKKRPLVEVENAVCALVPGNVGV